MLKGIKHSLPVNVQMSLRTSELAYLAKLLLNLLVPERDVSYGCGNG